MVSSVAVYAAGAIALAGAVALFRRRTRRVGAALIAGGVGLAIVVLAWPVSEEHVTTPSTHLDAVMPRWQFNERHAIHIDATPERVFDAIRNVRADEISLFATLTAIRRGGRKQPESIINAAKTKPLLEVATSTGFVYLADDAPRELVVGTVVVHPPNVRGRLTPEVFRKQLPPGFALATMNFVVTPDAHGSNVTTETRVYANDAASARKFAVYWRIIHPGSDIIRRTWLRAIKRRAEARASRT
jgi:hypothetical protein